MNHLLFVAAGDYYTACAAIFVSGTPDSGDDLSSGVIEL